MYKVARLTIISCVENWKRFQFFKEMLSSLVKSEFFTLSLNFKYSHTEIQVVLNLFRIVESNFFQNSSNYNLKDFFTSSIKNSNTYSFWTEQIDSSFRNLSLKNLVVLYFGSFVTVQSY